jgi:hypothetical protein
MDLPEPYLLSSLGIPQSRSVVIRLHRHFFAPEPAAETPPHYCTPTLLFQTLSHTPALHSPASRRGSLAQEKQL